MTFIRWNELTKLDESRWNCIFALASCWKSKIYIIWCLQKVLCVGDNKWRPSVAVFVLKCVSWRPPGSPPPVWRVASGLPTSVPRAGCSELGVAPPNNNYYHWPRQPRASTIYRVINNSCYLVDVSESHFNLCIFLSPSSLIFQHYVKCDTTRQKWRKWREKCSG